MDTNQKRQELLKVYPHWTDKVAKMSDAQVTAIFLRLQSSGKLGK